MFRGSRCDRLAVWVNEATVAVGEWNLIGTALEKGGAPHLWGGGAPMVAGVRFELTTFGLCDLTQLSLRVGLYLHPE